MKKAVILTANSFRDEEVSYPFIRLQEAGMQVVLATPGGKAPTSEHGFPMEKMYPTVLDVESLKADEYNLVILPGGVQAPDVVRGSREALVFVKAMYDAKKIVAAICHGPWILISAGIISGKRATCHPNMIDDLKNAGAIYVDASVVEDENIITSRRPRDLGDFMKSVLTRFAS